MVTSFHKKRNRGFSFVELIVGVAVFTIIIFSVYGAYTSIFEIVYTSRAKLDSIDLIDEQIEVIRNMPYSQIGIVNGVPSGILTHTQTLTRDSNQFTMTTYVRNIDNPFDGIVGGTPNDTSPADYKLVELDIDCPGCRHFVPVTVTTTVAPKSLETASTNGALFIHVFDASGQPVKDAAVHVVNSQVTPPVIIDDVTDNTGLLEIIDAPPGTNAYQITISKTGYTSDGTLPANVQNPHPTKPYATVLLQQVTAVSFTIDKVSSFAIHSVTPTCGAVSNFHYNLQGSKTIGTNPIVYKYNQNLTTDSGGNTSLSNMEWDSFVFKGTDSSYDILGTNPLLPVNLGPNSNQDVQLIIGSKNPDTVLVTVRDSGTGQPISDALVTLGSSLYASTTFATGQGVITQTDWSGGSGQATSTNITKYWSNDGNIITSSPVGDLTLRKVSGVYSSSGELVSSAFDTGSPSNFQSIRWLPASQPSGVGSPDVRFQVATNNDGGTWSFSGPDGTSGTYYTSSNQNIYSGNNGNQYFKYKVYENTASTSITTDISDVSFTFTSSCTPPGQVAFQGLPAGSYVMHVSKTGYTSQDIPITVNSSWMSQDVFLISN